MKNKPILASMLTACLCLALQIFVPLPGAEAAQVAGKTGFASDTGARPANVPARYIATPLGYVAPECVVVLKPHERLQGAVIVSSASKATRRIAPCTSLRYEGSSVATTTRKANPDFPAPSDPNAFTGFAPLASITGPRFTSPNVVTMTLTVPPAPTKKAGQSIYIVSGAIARGENTSGLYNVLAWNMMNEGTEWAAATWQTFADGTMVVHRTLAVMPGDEISQHISAAGQYVNMSGPLIASVKTKSGSGYDTQEIYTDKAYNSVDLFGFTIDGIKSCDQLPPGGSINGNFGSGGSGGLNRRFGPRGVCELDARIGDADFTMSYSNAVTPAARSATITYTTTGK